MDEGCFMSLSVLKEKNRVYLDYSSTTPLLESLPQRIFEWSQKWGNPSSNYELARESRALIWKAREDIARFIHCNPLEIIFTSGGSETNNYAIKGLCEKFLGSDKNKIITSSVEHPSVTQTMKWAQKKGFQVEIIPVNSSGELDKEKFEKALDEKTAFVSLMYVNNETGCIFPIQELAQMSHQVGALFHSDGIQSLGKIPIHVEELGVDLMSFSGHKFYSLKGCGALYCKKGLNLESLIHGGSQERKRRAGTENVLSICSLGAACEQGEKILKEVSHLSQYRDKLEATIKKNIPNVKIVGQESPRVGTITSILIPDLFAETVLINLDLKGYSVSVSSACNSGSILPSPVLIGMGYSVEEAQCVLRVSFGLGTTNESLQNFASDLQKIVNRLTKLKEKGEL